MKALLPFFIFSVFILFCTSKASLPKNIIQEHIKKHADFSVDPCVDFYAHVCPWKVERYFMEDLSKLKAGMVAKYRKKHPKFDKFKGEDAFAIAEALKQLNIEQLKSECKPSKPRLSSFFISAQDNRTIENVDEVLFPGFENYPCEEKAAIIIKEVGEIEDYTTTRSVLVSAVNGFITSKLVEKLDVKARKLFNKFKSVISKEIIKTPWAKNYKAIEQYVEALSNITFRTFADVRITVKKSMELYESTEKDCRKKLDVAFSQPTAELVCKGVATRKAEELLDEPIEDIFPQDQAGILKDVWQMFNSFDNSVYIGNEFLLLLNTDYFSDLYGSIGFSMIHEIMHTLVFDDNDLDKPLSKLWTKNADCVKDQALKTCETFPTVTEMHNMKPACNTTVTFEEDAADLAAYRIAWRIYENSYARKTVVPNYEALDKKQLFFYGAAVFFCNQDGMSRVPFQNLAHSNNYQRVNSLMSQMKQFSDAFKCKPTDKMITNRAKHCELYGSGSPMTRKKNAGNYY
ncbi:Peptidase M13 C-terminal domain-containing protein [Caenorhabditis elegans]|uniref:Peptidase M13 C-terminal domain-containing protein n=1 Tax=Caenorhabditis elegans TaxID=6239 RepID=Q23427_CAEEL|nr:Peptidase M13 C-terminal domain-containing protein [Caenorhabditis elegans]CCD72504.1 Peptidase M13 C-terminal domain-containing protein [Caenorhabditis elegans]|eukprot:NP_495164.2 NEPrilysin metallopeptidase family [Caenorhabditis elegans]